MIFVDSSAWLAVTDVRDGFHNPALVFYRDLVRGASGRLVTSDYILDETLTLIRGRLGRDVAREFVGGLAGSPSLQQIWVTPAHYQAALELFLGQGNKHWSFTDCTSFTIMREFGIETAFTFDSDFRQAGFQAQPV